MISAWGAAPSWLKASSSPLRGFGSSRFGLFASGAAQALAGQLDAMRIVDEAVQDGVGVRWSPGTTLMPRWTQRELGGDDRRPAARSRVLEDFEQIVTGAGVEGFEAEVVENEQISAADGFDEARMAAVARVERQVLAELWPAMIEDGPIVATGFRPTLAQASQLLPTPDGRPRQIVVRRSIRPPESFWNRARSRPRAAR